MTAVDDERAELRTAARLARIWQGGTFWHCPMNCYRGFGRTRFRTAKAARRHVRRHHA